MNSGGFMARVRGKVMGELLLELDGLKWRSVLDDRIPEFMN